MTINGYVKQWCDEDYDVRKEDFYISNAYYVADREWAVSGFKHGIFALIVAIATMMISSEPSITTRLFESLINMGILTVCFWLYGIRNYNANSVETSLIIYVMVAILLFITKNRVPAVLNLIFIIATIPLYLFFSIINPIKFIFVANEMKKKIVEEEREEEERDTQRYAQWTSGYKAYRYGLPEVENESSDPQMESARNMFVGYMDNKQMLKTRYRQLAKQYHPDKGGDTKLFQCIIAAYEEINAKLT